MSDFEGVVSGFGALWVVFRVLLLVFRALWAVVRGCFFRALRVVFSAM